MVFKRTVSFLLAVCMLFLLFGCSSTEKKESSTNTSMNPSSNSELQGPLDEDTIKQEAESEPENEARVVYLLNKYVDRWGNKRIYHYDAENHITSSSIEDDGSDTVVETQFTYENDRITSSMINEACRGEYFYDDQGILTSIHYVHRYSDSEYGYNFVYNDHGSISEVNFYGEIPEFDGNHVGNYCYAAETFIPDTLYMEYFPMMTLNQLYLFGLGKSYQFEYEYDNNGRIKNCIRHSKDNAAKDYQQLTLDSNGRITQYLSSSFRIGKIHDRYILGSWPEFDYEKWVFTYSDDGDISATVVKNAWINIGFNYKRTEYTLHQNTLSSNYVEIESDDPIPLDTLEIITYEQWKDDDFRRQYASNYDLFCKQYNIENYGNTVHISVDEVDDKGFTIREDIESYEYIAVPVQGNTLPDFPFVIVP